MKELHSPTSPRRPASSALRIARASADNREAIRALLLSVKLPVADLPQELTHFFAVFSGQELAATAGLECYGPYALLRSVAVSPAFQGQGLGQLLYEQILLEAQQLGLQQLFLITNTADRYFASKGFARIDRSQAPQAIQQTQQFSSICPGSAIVMEKQLG